MKIRNDDAQINVRVDGDGDETIVLIHGFPLAHEIWDAQVAALASAFRVVRPDLRGMGGSSVPDGPYLMETLAGDIAAVLDSLGVERATLVGHSLGGYVALAFARMYLERIARLALVASRIDADAPERAAWRRERADDLERTRENAGLVEEMLGASFAPGTRERAPELYARTAELARRNDPRGLAAMLRGMALRDSAEDIVPDLALPVLILAGALDPSVPLETARASAAAFPAARLALAPQSGHLPMLEEPEVVTAELRRLMSERPAG